MLNISTDWLLRLWVILLYGPVALLVYKRLIPRLSLSAKLVATVMLAAQVIVIVVSLEHRPTSDFERWLWHLGREWNIPTLLASAQLALVAGVSLLTVWLARERLAWQRFYLLGIALVFLFMAWDELTDIRLSINNWRMIFVVLGATVVAATAIMALRSHRRSWLWHLCLLTGLAIAAFGALGLDHFRYLDICSVGIIQFDRCVSETPFEEPLELLGIWIVLLAVLGQFSDAAPPKRPKIQRALYALPPLWVFVMVLFHPIFSLEIPASEKPASVRFESGLRLLGYSIEKTTAHSIARLYSSTRQSLDEQMGYSVHIVDQVTGDSIASRNDILNSRDKVSRGNRDFTPLYLQQIELDILPEAPANRALWIVLTHWKEYDGKFRRQQILSSDLPLLDDTQVVLGELVLPAVGRASLSAPLAIFDNGFRLESFGLPERAKAGETLSIPFTWRSDVGSEEDHVQFLHFGHMDSDEWWVHDQSPLGQRLPTRLWYSGLADRETWQVPLPADLAPGRYSVFTGLYRVSDQERLPATDAEGTPWLDNQVRLGSLLVENRS